MAISKAIQQQNRRRIRIGHSSTFVIKMKLVFAAMTLAIVYVQSGVIVQGPQSITVIEGDTVILSCRADGLDETSGQAVIWEETSSHPTISHNRQIVREEKMNRFSIVGNETNGEYNLQITSVIPEDNGIYSCSVFRGSSTNASAFLTVLYPPSNKYPVCFPLENKLQFTEIEMLSIVCKTGISYPPANVSWMNANSQVINDTNVVLIGDEYIVSHKEVIYNYHDGASFTCSVSHPLWSKPKNCSIGPLYILYRPLITISVQMTTANVELKCVAIGNPSTFTYKWVVFLGNQTSPQVYFKKLDIMSETDSLILQRTDYYSAELVVECSARNSEGEGRTNATIMLSSSHCRGSTTKIIDVCRTISVPTICVLVILIILSLIAIVFLIMKIQKLRKSAAKTDVSNVSSRVEMKRKGNNGVYVTLTESIENLERI